jgi:hypothetical protein
MSTLQEHLSDLRSALDAYECGFDWSCFCLSFGHPRADGHHLLQQLYQRHSDSARARSELYALVGAHWEAVNAAHELAATREPGGRPAAQQRLRQARAQHRQAVRALRQAWSAPR